MDDYNFDLSEDLRTLNGVFYGAFLSVSIYFFVQINGKSLATSTYPILTVLFSNRQLVFVVLLCFSFFFIVDWLSLALTSYKSLNISSGMYYLYATSSVFLLGFGSVISFIPSNHLRVQGSHDYNQA